MDQPSFTRSAGTGSDAVRKARVRLTGLDVDLFRHPLDRQATNNLKRVPGFDKAVARFIEWGVERIEYVEHTASGVRVGPRQLPRVHGLLREACAVLDIREPELYVRQGPPNAYTSGHNHPYIVLFTELIDLMSEDELLGVLSHEAGHIKCGHVLYKTMARVFGGAATAGMRRVNPMTVAVGLGIGAALKSWDRASEFTADRAAMLATQDLDACVGMMMKLAGGVRSDEMGTAAFLEQAQHLDVLAAESKISRLHRFQLRVGSGHPLVVERARRFQEWIASGEPGDIVARYAAATVPAQPTTGPDGRY
ncbi:M48 family metallopeptidase [Pseudofrankia sp. BMG5.37]|uniref:M48 family metallopeptidase n=1 Tax=Pseudofrankia sp. BMG5.37 TaxID=3050035 RepID=UPI0028955FDB|nr:M48 family metallopeptidase [Pseudofrankia sp. BMG5.37]MDT3442386.1 M48 family metallopeptidase [Pseudofrankia sp. BMG5.37]